MAITASQVKELRERSGAGMMECKKALVAVDGDIEAAIEHLRKSGAAQAAKKAGRIAAEGAIVASLGSDSAALVEVNSETDFVANDDNFTQFTEIVAQALLQHRPPDIDALNAIITDGGDAIEQMRINLIAKIGENVSVRRFEILDFGDGFIESYVHGKRIGVLVAMEGGTRELARHLAMHIAAINPLGVSEADLPADLVAKEREIQIAQAQSSGKPPDIVEKMVNGRLKKFINEITLHGQAFVKDPELTVAKLLDENDAMVSRFIRYEVGEGIEKRQDNFAEEVMEQARSAAQS